MASMLLRLPGRALRLSGRILKLPFKVLTLGIQGRTWLLFYCGYFAALLVKGLVRKLRRREEDAYDGLDGIVSFSSRLIAGGQ